MVRWYTVEKNNSIIVKKVIQTADRYTKPQKKIGNRNSCEDFVYVTKYFYDGNTCNSKYLLFLLILFYFSLIFLLFPSVKFYEQFGRRFKKKKKKQHLQRVLQFSFKYTISHMSVLITVNCAVCSKCRGQRPHIGIQNTSS